MREGKKQVACKIVNLEFGRPTVEAAMQRLSQELRLAQANRIHTLKIIHGYGSTGQGGAIRKATHLMLKQRRMRGQIKCYIPGEEFSAFHNAGRMAVQTDPRLRQDSDFGRQNDGITIVLL